jgi:phosphotriesterase-related protein
MDARCADPPRTGERPTDSAGGSLLPVTAITTTLGPMRADQLGTILAHEHVFVDLRRWDQPGYADADPMDVVARMGPEIERARAAGVSAIVECSTVGVGRRADIDLAVSRATGFPLVVPTGIYREPWVPAWAHEWTEDELAAWMLRELNDAIAGTGVQAGWIKLSAGDDGLTATETKILRAAARAAQATNSVIGSHTIRGRVVRDQLDIIEAAGLGLDRFIWIHTQAEPDVELHLEIARRGAWIEYDAVGADDFNDAYFVERIQRALDAGLGGRVLLSQDRGWFDPAQPGGGVPRPYTYLADRFLPALRDTGVSAVEVETLIQHNPFDAFAR